jgi:predicted RNA-binding protein with PUA-like domain
VSRENPHHHQRLQNLKASRNAAYKCVNKANKTAHQNNKRLYDRRAKLRNFKVGDLVYLYSPAMKPGLSQKFNSPGQAHTR